MQVGQFKDHAAVLIAIAQDLSGGEEVLLTRRADHLTLHSGEVAFPGGKWEEDDQDLLHTALRESHEEVGLAPSRVDIIDQLPIAHTRLGMSVTPYVGRVDSKEGLLANDDELDSLFWVPMGYLLADRRARTDIFELNGIEYWAPVYEWMGYTIWGFTARVLVDFMNRVYGKSIKRENQAPEIRYHPQIPN